MSQNLNDLCSQIAVSADQLNYLLEQIKIYIPLATVWAFGSRVQWSHRPASDLDLAVLCDKETSLTLLKLNEVFRESDLPYKVQLLDFYRLSENMQENIRRKYVVIYQPDKDSK